MRFMLNRTLLFTYLVLVTSLVFLVTDHDGASASSDPFEEGLRYFTPEAPVVNGGAYPVFSPDDRYVAMYGLRVFDLEEGEWAPIGPLSGRTFWSPDGGHLAHEARDNVTVWNTTTWQLERMVALPPYPVLYGMYDIGWSGNYIVGVDTNGSVLLLDTTTWDYELLHVARENAWAIAVNPNMTLMAIGYSHNVDILSFPEGNFIKSFWSSAAYARTLDWSDDGELLYLSGQSTVESWHVENGTRHQRGFGSGSPIAFAVDTRNDIAYVGTSYGEIRVLEGPELVYDGKLWYDFRYIKWLALSNNGTDLFIMGYGYDLVHIPTREVVMHVDGSSYAYRDAVYRGDVVALVDSYGFDVWNVSNGSRLISVGSYQSISFIRVSLSSTSEYVALSYRGPSGTSFVSIYSLKNSTMIERFPVESSIYDIAWHPVSDLLAFLVLEGEVRFYYLPQDRFLTPLDLGGGYGRDLLWGPNGTQLVVSVDKEQYPDEYKIQFYLWPSLSLARAVDVAETPLSMAFSPNGARFVYALQRVDPVIIDTATFQELAMIPTKGRGLYNIAWDPTNRTIAGTSVDRIEVYWTSNLSLLTVIPTRGGDLAFTPDGLGLYNVFYELVLYRLPYITAEVGGPSAWREDVTANLRVFNITSYYEVSASWDFGDGGNATGLAVSHAWAEPGTYDVRVTLSHERGYRTVLRHVIEVSDETPPTAHITGPVEVPEDTKVVYSASGSSDNAGVVQYQWVVEGDATYTTMDILLSFSEPGTYHLELTVWDAAGHRDSQGLDVTVRDVTPPSVNFTCPDVIDEDSTLVLSASPSSDNVGITGYLWSLGDGRTLEGETVEAVYPHPGTYGLTLNVTDAEGNWATMTRTLRVRDVTPPEVRYRVIGDLLEDAPVTFDANGTRDPGSGLGEVTWHFPDDHVLTGERVVFTFVEPGSYNVTLVVVDTVSNTNETTIVVEILDVTPPTAATWAEDRTVPEDTAVTFNGSLSTDNVGVVRWLWTVPGGEDVEAMGFTHTFAEPGAYTLSLTVWDAAGLEDTIKVNVTVLDVTSPVLAVEPQGPVNLTMEGGGPVTLEASASGSHDNVGITTIEWDVGGDGTVEATGWEASLQLGRGRHTVVVTARDAAGNEASQTLEVTVRRPPEEEGGSLGVIIAAVLLAIVAVVAVALVLMSRGRERAP